MSLWDDTPSDASSPTSEETEGYPVVEGYSSVPVYRNLATLRENMQIKGINFIGSGGQLPTVDGPEDGRWNQTARRLYRAYCRWNTLIAFCGNVDCQKHAPNNLPINYIAWESGTRIGITWPRNHNDAPQNQRVQPGWGIYDGYSYALIMDIEYAGAGGDYEYAYLHVSRYLNADLLNQVTVYRNVDPYEWIPEFPHTPTTVCKYCIATPHLLFSTWKDTYPFNPKSAGITNTHYCAKIEAVGVNLSAFSSSCTNTSCPHYTLQTQRLPTLDAVDGMILNRGRYTIRKAFSQQRVEERERYSGALEIIGANGGLAGGVANTDEYQDYLFGLLRVHTGQHADTGISIYKNFRQFDAVGAHDTDTILGLMTNVDKPKPTGDIFTNDGDIMTFETAVGVRRVRSCVNSNYSASPFGVGYKGAQRIKPKVYVSEPFTLAVGTYANQETSVIVSSSIVFQIRRFGETTTLSTTHLKTVASTINSSRTVAYNAYSGQWEYSPSSPFLLCEIDLGIDLIPIPDIDYANPYLSKMDYVPHYSGGNFVAPEIICEYTDLGFGASGDRQSKAFPGDIVGITVDGVERFARVVYAKAFAGGESTVPSYNALSRGIPAARWPLQKKRDVVVIDCRTSQAYPLRTTATGAAIRLLGHTGVSSDMDEQGVSESIVELLIVRGDIITPITTYEFDNVDGRIIFTHTLLPDETYRVCATVHINDTRTTFPCEDVASLHNITDDLCDHTWLQLDGLVASKDFYLVARHPDLANDRWAGTIAYVRETGLVDEYGNPVYGKIINTYEKGGVTYSYIELDMLDVESGDLQMAEYVYNRTPAKLFDHTSHWVATEHAGNTFAGLEAVEGFVGLDNNFTFQFFGEDVFIPVLDFGAAVTCGTSFTGFLLSIKELKYFWADAVAEASIDISVPTDGITYRTNTREYYYEDGDFKAIDFWTDELENLSELDTKVFLVRIGADDAITVIPNIYADATFYKYNTHWAARIDITELVKYILSEEYDGTITYAMGFSLPGQETIENHFEIFNITCLERWTHRSWPNDNDTFHEKHKYLYFNIAEYTTSKLNVRINKDELINGPKLHIGIDGHAEVPNLT